MIPIQHDASNKTDTLNNDDSTMMIHLNDDSLNNDDSRNRYTLIRQIHADLFVFLIPAFMACTFGKKTLGMWALIQNTKKIRLIK